jgi:hypothetical protein
VTVLTGAEWALAESVGRGFSHNAVDSGKPGKGGLSRRPPCRGRTVQRLPRTGGRLSSMRVAGWGYRARASSGFFRKHPGRWGHHPRRAEARAAPFISTQRGEALSFAPPRNGAPAQTRRRKPFPLTTPMPAKLARSLMPLCCRQMRRSTANGRRRCGARAGSLRGECVAEGRLDFFEQAKPWLTGDAARGDQAALAASVGMNANALKVAVHRLKQRISCHVYRNLKSSSVSGAAALAWSIRRAKNP